MAASRRDHSAGCVHDDMNVGQGCFHDDLNVGRCERFTRILQKYYISINDFWGKVNELVYLFGDQLDQ